ncbi:MAG: response regulator [Chloroflexi bacterium]|nr:response regulator [Chloroflexota bacterium]
MSKILIVEDSPIQAWAFEHLLKQRGFKVLHARDGQFGITMAQKWMPDVIVLDVNMSDMDSFEVCRRLQRDAKTSHIPIIMLVANNGLPALRQSTCLGAVDFISKNGFTNTVLLEILHQLRFLAKTQCLQGAEST